MFVLRAFFVLLQHYIVTAHRCLNNWGKQRFINSYLLSSTLNIFEHFIMIQKKM